MRITLEEATDDELTEEVLERGLVIGVRTRDLVELMWGVKHNDPALVRDIVKRLAREHLGKII